MRNFEEEVIKFDVKIITQSVDFTRCSRTHTYTHTLFLYIHTYISYLIFVIKFELLWVGRKTYKLDIQVETIVYNVWMKNLGKYLFMQLLRFQYVGGKLGKVFISSTLKGFWLGKSFMICDFLILTSYFFYKSKKLILNKLSC